MDVAFSTSVFVAASVFCKPQLRSGAWERAPRCEVSLDTSGRADYNPRPSETQPRAALRRPDSEETKP